MKRAPRFLPLLVIAVGGVLAIRLLAGAASLPQLAEGARAWAEEMAPGAKKAKGKAKADAPDQAKPDAVKAAPAAPVPPGDVIAVAAPPQAVPVDPVVAPAPSVRSRAAVDDELFEAVRPTLSAFAGGRR